MDNTTNKCTKHPSMSPFHTAKEHNSSRDQQLYLSPTVLSPLLPPTPPFDPGMVTIEKRDSQENTTYTWEPATMTTANTRHFSPAGEPFIVNELEVERNIYNSPPSKSIFNHNDNGAILCTNQSKTDSTISSKDFFRNNDNQGTYAAKQLLNLQQYTVRKKNLPPQVPEVSEYGWSTSSQLNTSVGNKNKSFDSQESAKDVTFFDSSYLDWADFPILNKRMKFSLADKNQLESTDPCSFQRSSFQHDNGNSIPFNKNSFEPIPLSHTTVRESKNHVSSYLPTRRKDNLSDEDVNFFLQKMTAQQKMWVYRELNDEIVNEYLQKRSRNKTYEEVEDSTNLRNLTDQMEICAPVFPDLDYDHQEGSEEKTSITNIGNATTKIDANSKDIVNCSFRRGTDSLEGRSYFRSLPTLAFEEKLNWIVQTIDKVSEQSHIGYIESDRTFLLRIWKIYQCYTRHCTCDWKVFVSKYHKVSHSTFECICKETEKSD